MSTAYALHTRPRRDPPQSPTAARGAPLAGAGGRWTPDRRIRAWLLDRHHVGARRALQVVGFAGNAPVYLAAAGLAAAAAARRRGPRQAVPVVAAVAGAIGAHAAVKHAVGRPRPPGAAAAGNHKPSFPSGHTTRATAVSAIVAHVALREGLAPRGVVLPLAVAIPLGVGVSRAYTDRHWATDVAAGWALGEAVAACCARWYDRRGDGRRRA